MHGMFVGACQKVTKQPPEDIHLFCDGPIIRVYVLNIEQGSSNRYQHLTGDKPCSGGSWLGLILQNNNLGSKAYNFHFTTILPVLAHTI